MSTIAKAVQACDERKALALAVSDTIGKVYAARERYEAAKSRNAGNAAKLYDALLQARQLELHALHTLREHIEQHGCVV
jgi:hypothetical protein